MDTFTPQDEYMFRIAHAIEKWGFFIQYVLGDTDHPPWAYTIGFAERGLPEFVVIGLGDESSSYVLHWVHHELAAGRTIRIGRNRRHAIDRVPVRFVPVLAEYRDDRHGLFAAADGYYESTGGWPIEPRFFQLVWSENRAWPWQTRFPRRLRRLQPLLDVPGSLPDRRDLDRSLARGHVAGCSACEHEQPAHDPGVPAAFPAGYERLAADVLRTTGYRLVLRHSANESLGESTCMVEVLLGDRSLGSFGRSWFADNSELEVVSSVRGRRDRRARDRW